ncbi:MAG: DNA primase [Erysipelotrichaceae bacterium]|nr:DNA primase [Erysipelotrichaceae bacterium]
MRIDENLIQEIRNSADIVEVIGNYIPLIRKGKAVTAVCPFHDDHSPSLSISSDKQIYKCFVCNNGGNVFTFVKNFESISFQEAVVKVAKIIGKDITFEYSSKEVKDLPFQARYDALEEMIKFTQFNLNTVDGKVASEYLKKRKLDDSIIDAFQIGYNGLNNQVYHYLKAKGYPDDVLVESDIVRINEYGVKDVFEHRILFPIHDVYGLPIGFTARALDSNQSKYINTKETEIYKKGDVIYNYHRAKTMAKKEDKVYLLEGVIDVIAMYKAGYHNAVCSLGTSLTTNQLKAIKRLSNHLVFFYDGDEAGLNATYKAAMLAKEKGFHISVIDNDTQLDPDEIIHQYSIDKLKKIILKEIPWIQFLMKYLKMHLNLENYSDKKTFTQRIQHEIQQLDDDYDRQNFAQQLYVLTGYQANSHPITKKSTKIKRMVEEESNIDNGIILAEYEIINQLLISKKASLIFKEQLGFLVNQEANLIAMLILDYYRTHNEIQLNEFIDVMVEDSLRNLVLKISMLDFLPQVFNEIKLLGSIKRIKIELLKEKERKIKEQIALIDNSESQRVLIEELSHLQLERRRLIDENKSEQ